MVPAAKLLSLTASSAEFIFEGRFEDRPVSWRCQLSTLASLAQSQQQSQQRPFIEILPQTVATSQDKAEYQIMVGLNVPEIDHAVIEKTIIMIRNYKRLRPGRHEYGEAVEFPVD